MRCIGSFKCIFWKMDNARSAIRGIILKKSSINLGHRVQNTSVKQPTVIDCTLYTNFSPPSKSFNFQCFQSADSTCIATILKFILYSQGLFIYIHPSLPKIYKLLAWYFISILHLVAITPLKYCAKLNNKKDILQLIQINTNITYSGSVKPIVIFWTLFEAIYAPKSQHIKYKCLYNNTE